MKIDTSMHNVTNFLVPAAGTTHAMGYSGQFSATPYIIDWRQFKVDNFPFQPQGVYIDNSAGQVPLTINILPIGYKVVCPAGGVRAASFPAPNGQTCAITGDPANNASVVFVDYPVFDDNPNAVMTFNPLATGGVPLRTQELVPTTESLNDTIAAGANSVSLAPVTANQNVRKLQVYLSGDAALAAAGIVEFTITVNGVTIFANSIYVPGGGGAGSLVADLDFSSIGIPAAAGDIVVALSQAFTAGTVSVNAWLAPQ